MTMIQSLLIPLVTAFVAGIGAASLIPWPITALAVAACGVTAAILAVMRDHPRAGASLFMVLFFILGMMRFVQYDAIGGDDISRFIGSNGTVMGRIVDTPQVYPGEKESRVRYTVLAETLKTARQIHTVSGKIFVTAKLGKEGFIGGYDDIITVSGEISGLHGFQNPGAVDTVASWNRQGITARLSASSATITVGQRQGISATLAKLRQDLAALFLAVMPPADGAILNGVLFGGGYRDISPAVLRDFAATGIIHILSVSGSHIALVTIIMIWLGERLRLSPIITVVVAAGAMLFYALLAGLTPPVIRAVIMGLIALIALASEREKNGGRALAVAVLTMTAWKPSLIFDISFQLTVSGTAGLVFFYSTLATSLAVFPRWLASGLAVTVAAQVGMVPFLAYYFSSLPVASLFSNLIVVPIIEAVIFLGLGASLISLAVPMAAKFLLVLASLGIGLAVTINHAIASIPGLLLYVPPFTVWTGAIYYALLAWLVGSISFLPPFRETINRYRRHAAAVIVIMSGAAVIWSSLPQQAEVHFIDVGQGDASLIITPHRKAVLIDTGGTGSGAGSFDIGERVVVPYLRHHGIRELEFLILTHGHSDHAGGAAAIVDRIRVHNVMIAPEAIPSRLQPLLGSHKKSTLIPPAIGQVINVDGVTFAVIHTGEGSANEASAMIRVTYGGHSFLFTGDMEQKQEAVAVKKGLASATVLKVPHHGARTSSSTPFLNAVKPEHAVISVGAANRFGHPHPEVVQRLVEGGAKMYRTDKQGAIRFTSDGEKLTVAPYRE